MSIISWHLVFPPYIKYTADPMNPGKKMKVTPDELQFYAYGKLLIPIPECQHKRK